MEDILVPIFICCVLPLGIVVTVFLAGMYGDKKRTEVLSKAIEAGGNVDIDKLVEAMGRRRRSPLETLNRRLLWGFICVLTGVCLIVVPLVLGMQKEYDDYQTFIIFGSIIAAIGVALLLVYFMTRKQVMEEMHREGGFQENHTELAEGEEHIAGE